MSMKKSQSRGLGRGLSALMADISPEAEDGAKAAGSVADRVVPIEMIRPNPNQPRRDFDKEQLDNLAASISSKGIIQPLIVRPAAGTPGEYEIVAGERRWRAAQIAKLHDVPVVIRDVDDTEILEIAIIENIQRADLNPVEEATGYRQLMHKFGHTQERLSEALGKSRSHIANCLRLLSLPDEVQNYLREGKLSSGHARALISSENPIRLAQHVIDKSLSVRDTEALVRSTSTSPQPEREGRRLSRRGDAKDADTKALEQDLSATLTMKVTIDHKPGTDGGQMTIRYESLDQLDRLVGMLSV